MKRGNLLISYRHEWDITEDEFNRAISTLRNSETTNNYQREYLDTVTYENFNVSQFNSTFFKNPMLHRRDLSFDFIFIPKLTEILQRKSDVWENDREPFTKIRIDDIRPGPVRTARSLLSSVQSYTLGSDLDIYEYGKTGFEFILKSRGNASVKALPACEEFFYRDWKRDGICVKSTDIFIKRTYAIITPESVKEGGYVESGMIDDDEGLMMGEPKDVARYLSGEGALLYSGCPPGTWYETDFLSNPDDESQEQTSYHIHNADKYQEMEIFKKLFPKDWQQRCAD